MRCRVVAISLSDSTLKKGDCRRERLRATFRESSKVVSPVLLIKSARTMVSSGVNAERARRECQTPTTAAQARIKAAANQAFECLRAGRDSTGTTARTSGAQATGATKR